jgi:hypothetical protein
MIVDAQGNPIRRDASAIAFPTRATAWVGGMRSPGDQASVANQAALNIQTGLTVEFWHYAFTKTVNFPIVVQKGNANTAYTFQRDNTTDKMTWRCIKTAAQNNVLSSATITKGVWEHWAGTYNGTQMELVKNGTSDGTTALTGNIDTNANPLRVGGSEIAANANQNNGLIYDLRIWNIARSAATIAAERSTLVSASAPGLVANWLFSEGRGTQVADRTANAFHLTCHSQMWRNVALPY